MILKHEKCSESLSAPLHIDLFVNQRLSFAMKQRVFFSNQGS